MSSISKKIKKKEYELTRGFFQLLAENNADRLKPVVQIMNSRPTNDESSIRVRLSDGTFSYGGVLLKDNAVKKFGSYELEKSQCLIKLTGFCSNISNNENAKRVHLNIFDFELLEKDSPIIGSPTPHSGIPVTYMAWETKKVSQQPLKEPNFQFSLEEVTTASENIECESSKNYPSIIPVISISPHLKQWKIHGVVTNKSEIRYFETPKGRGEVFDFSITDKEGTEIRVSCFGGMVSKYNELIKLYSTYIIKGSDKAVTAAKICCNNTGHKYEITMRSDVGVIKCENSIPLPPQKIDRVGLSKIKMFLGKHIDVVAVVDDIKKKVDVICNNGVTQKTSVSLIDESGSLVTLTVWGDSCKEFTDDLLHKPIILKSLAVKESGEKCSLKFVSRSKIISPGDVGIFKDISD
uniref:REPA_OB_2 domain-containing protein n=1 Tax=Strongyloides papillosus TaxID=174720 RepID=A0A0N5CGM5_STREA